jgi:DNA-directed DNA polymerase III PolC
MISPPIGYIHLRSHTCFSLLEGLPSPAALVRAAKALGMPALGMTDHHHLGGAIEFYRACLEEGIRPLLGLEVDLESPAGAPEAERQRANPGRGLRLALLAENTAGWSSLCHLVSALQLRDEPEKPCSLELLNRYSSGLVALADARLEELSELFPQRCYFALADRDEHLESLARRLQVPVVAAPPAYFLEPHHAPLQRLVTAIRLNCSLAEAADAAAAQSAWLVPPGEMLARFEGLPQALNSTLEIAERCRCELPIGKPHFPRVALPPGQTAIQVLRQKAEAGARLRYSPMTSEIMARLERELEVIESRGFEPVFLIMEEILSFARRSGIPFSSRGSAASSLVAHCLGITLPDPLYYNLYFERFLNPARSTPPDIDTDLCSRRRDEVIQYVFDTFGAGQVAMVGTINRFRPRSALGDAAKAHGLPPETVRRLTSSLPYGFFANREAREAKAGYSPFAELKQAYPDRRYQQIFRDAEALLELPRHLSVHAGGVIIAPGELADLVPLQRSGLKGVVITQFDLESVEQMGLIKIDLLGIRGLTVLGDVAQAVFSWRRKDYRQPLDVLEEIPGDDPHTADCIEQGKTIGCFQIESPGMRATLREIRARSPDDLVAALALYRPGPMTGGMKTAFVRRFKGEEPVSHLHPALAPMLDETYGVILYQEQVLRIAHELAGLTLADADLLRRAMSHFDPGRQMELLQERFVNGAREKSSVPEDTAQRVWEMMAAFAGYGFPKAHAASYARVAWHSAWCKTHFPAEFMAAVLANWGGYYSQRVYLSEARRLRLLVRPPHINHSKREFAVSYPSGEAVLYMGLDQVRDLTSRLQERILKQRPFHSVEDFLLRADPRPQEAENLVKVGALEGLGTIPDLLERIKRVPRRSGQLGLFDFAQPADEGEWSLNQKTAAQQEILGIGVEVHPLELFADRIAASGALTTVEAAGKIGERVTVAGIRQTGRRSRTARGEMMAFLTIEDLEGTLDAVLFPDAYQRSRALWGITSPILVTGIVEMDEERAEPVLMVEKLLKL